jgi:hypothetical protein
MHVVGKTQARFDLLDGGVVAGRGTLSSSSLRQARTIPKSRKTVLRAL